VLPQHIFAQDHARWPQLTAAAIFQILVQLQWWRKQSIEVDARDPSCLDRGRRHKVLADTKHVVLFAVRHGDRQLDSVSVFEVANSS
jgi:hypothetical protein